MVNPYICYAISFGAALLLYPLAWSELYPDLTLSLLLFLVVTIILNVILAIRWSVKNKFLFKNVSPESRSAPLYLTIFIYALWSAEFLYNDGIPLIKIILQQRYDYKLFGIPKLHVFVVTFSSFYTIFLFQIYLSKKSGFILALYVLNLFAALLIYNRGMLFFNITASAFLYLMYKRTISFKKVTLASIFFICLFYFFGVLGSLRVTNESRKGYSNEEFLDTGKASAAFRNSIIPSEFFWSYIYSTSPIANLQNNVNVYQPQPTTSYSILHWLNNEVLFDFISKRINSFTGSVREGENTIPGPFNASTVYSRSFSYLGWPGLILMSIVIILMPIIFLKILPASSPFFSTGLVIVNTIFLFMVFDNTLRFTGLSFQLAYPVLLHYSSIHLPWLKKLFI